MSGGRPSLYRPAYCDELVNLMATGLSLTAAMASLGFVRQTAYDWAALHPEFAYAIALGHAKRSLALEERGLRGESGPLVTYIMKALPNCNPEDFRERKEVEHTHTINPSEMSDDDLARIASGRSAGVAAPQGNPRVIN